MIFIFTAKLAYHFYCLLKIDRLTERFVVEGVCNDWSLPIIVHIDLDTFQSIIQIL